ncbi:MAG: CAP domain-containing protein [Terracidiphilus sp.]
MSLTVALIALLSQRSPAAEPYNNPQTMPGAAEQLFALANQTRANYGLGALKWDPALAAGALQHCIRMTQSGSISHQYRGEPDVTARAGHAGAHFSLIEENIALGPYASGIHQGWMNSPGHRANLLNPAIDRVGIAVLARGGELYAVADYSRAVAMLTPGQVEAAFAGLLRARGLAVLRDANQARALCASSGRFMPQDGASFLMRWQGSDVTQLPADLARRVASGEYRQAAVGSCPAQNVDGGFTAFRVAVLLYGANTAALP